jgi:hypothetical protein
MRISDSPPFELDGVNRRRTRRKTKLPKVGRVGFEPTLGITQADFKSGPSPFQAFSHHFQTSQKARCIGVLAIIAFQNASCLRNLSGVSFGVIGVNSACARLAACSRLTAMKARSQNAPTPPQRDLQFTVRLSLQATTIADALANRHGLRSRAAAIEYALRKVGRKEGIDGLELEHA